MIPIGSKVRVKDGVFEEPLSEGVTVPTVHPTRKWPISVEFPNGVVRSFAEAELEVIPVGTDNPPQF